MALMLLHESGHMLAAHNKGCQVLGIELYPIFGLCRFEAPWSRFDHCVIAWGGVERPSYSVRFIFICHSSLILIRFMMALCVHFNSQQT